MSLCKTQTKTVSGLFPHKLTLSQAKLLEVEFQLSGSDAYAARFGETIADLGDVDDDGYHGNNYYY